MVKSGEKVGHAIEWMCIFNFPEVDILHQPHLKTSECLQVNLSCVSLQLRFNHGSFKPGTNDILMRGDG